MTPSRTLAVGALALCLCACAAPAYAITDTGAGGQNDVGADTPTVDTTNFGVWTTLDGDADQTGAPGQSDTTDVPTADTSTYSYYNNLDGDQDQEAAPGLYDTGTDVPTDDTTEFSSYYSTIDGDIDYSAIDIFAMDTTDGEKDLTDNNDLVNIDSDVVSNDADTTTGGDSDASYGFSTGTDSNWSTDNDHAFSASSDQSASMDWTDDELTDLSFWGDGTDTGDYTSDDDTSDNTMDGIAGKYLDLTTNSDKTSTTTADYTDSDSDTGRYEDGANDGADATDTRFVFTVDSGVDSPTGTAHCADADADGVCDHSDNCVDESNPDQANADGDGMGDACDDDDTTVTDCRFVTETGIHKMMVAPGVESLVYCDASLNPPAASVFYLEDVNDFRIEDDSLQCMLETYGTPADDVHDNFMLWLDGSTMYEVGPSRDALSNKQSFWYWNSDGSEDKALYNSFPGLDDVPSAFNVEHDHAAIPIMFYAANKVAFISREESLLWWDGVAAPVQVPALMPCFAGHGPHGSDSTLIISSDGVNTVSVTFMDDLTCRGTFMFNWFDNSVSASKPKHMPSLDWTESYDDDMSGAFHEQLFTVNGRAFYWFDDDEFRMSGPAYDPFNEGSVHGMGYRRYHVSLPNDDNAYQFDFMNHVDLNGRVWLADSNAFECDSDADNVLEAVRTNMHALNFAAGGCGAGQWYDEAHLRCAKCEPMMCADGMAAEMADECKSPGMIGAGPMCAPCNGACATCNGTTDNECTACAPGHFHAGCGRCEPCEVGCASCHGTRLGQCDSCEHGWHFDAEIGLCLEGDAECGPGDLF